MGKTFNLSVVIGAALSGTFKSTIGGALGQVKALGSSISRLESGRADIDRFRKLKTDLEGAKAALTAAQAEAGKLAREFKAADAESARLGKGLAAAKERLAAVAAEMKGAKRPGEELKQAYAAAKSEVKSLGEAQRQAARQASVLGESFSTARTKVGSLKAQVENQSVSLQRLRQQMAQAGISTRSLAADQAKLGAALERARSAQAKLGAALAAQQANLEKRGNLRGQMLDAIAMGAGLRAMIKSATEKETAEVRLGTVIDPDVGSAKAKQSLAAASRQATIFARNNMMPVIQHLDIQYALNSAGMEAAMASLNAGMVAKVATVTRGVPEQVAEVMATTWKNLGKRMEGDDTQKMARIGDLFTKTQFKFQIRDFGQLGETMKYATPSIIEWNMELGHALTMLGVLNSSGLQGEKAGTALMASLRQLGKASKELNFQIAYDPKGGLDLIQTMENLSKAIGGFDHLSQETRDALQKAFGDEGKRAILLLGEKMGELREAQQDVITNSKGLIDKGYQTFLDSTGGKLAIFQNRLKAFGGVVGKSLLPAINPFVDGLGRCALALAELAERFPLLTTVIATTMFGFIGLRVATIAFGYAGTFVKGGILSLGVALRSLQASIALARGGMVAMTATAGGTALGGFAAKALTPVRALGNAVLHPVATVRSLGSALAGLGRGAARGAGAGLRSIGSAALGMGRFLLNPVGALRSLGGAMLGFARLAVPAVVGGIRAIGLALLTNPVGIGLAVITTAALLIYKYWEPLKAFFGGLWEGFKGGFAGAFGGIGAALAPLQPVFNAVGTAVNWVGSGIKSLVGWFGNLLGPANTSSETLKQCASAGQIVGQVLGVVVGGAVKLLIAPFQLLGSAVQFVWNLFQNGPYQAVVNGFNQIKAWLENFSLADVGRKIIGTLVGGIKSVGSAVKNAVKSAFTHADPMFPHSDAQEGPFSRLTASGRALLTTFGAGIEAAGRSALINPLGRIFGAARQVLSRPLGAAANLIPNIQVPEMFGRARRLLGAAALALPLALQPVPALPSLGPNLIKTPAIQAIGRSIPPAAPALPEIGGAARWQTISPRIPLLPDLQGRASWSMAPPLTPRLPELGGSLTWRSTSPAVPGVPEIGAAARWETVTPRIPVLPDLQAQAFWNVARPAIPRLPHLGASLSWRSLPPAAPAIPEIGAAARWETITPQAPALPDLQGRASWSMAPPLTPRLPELGGSLTWRSTSPAVPGVPEIGAAARWETVTPRIPVLPDLQAQAFWNVARPAIPRLPHLGASLSWRSRPPAAPVLPEIGAAIRAERPKPEIPALADLSGVRPGVESPQGRTPIIINMGDIVVNAASGADGADIAAQVREQVRLALEEARRSLEAEQRGALHD